ncbi:MAG: DUF3794 domain-containing protein [Clostridia bacterium]|nr:DUF3794 domain-containing protein [Clostridia bacterium]
MDISLKYEDYKFLKEKSDNTVEESLEAELSLPEYMPEILRIIKSTAETKINSCRLVGERVTVDGVCDLRMIYTAEDGGIYTFSQSRPFTRHCENPLFNDCTDALAETRVSYVNCRATGTKRAEIKAGITIKFTVSGEESTRLVSRSETKGIEQKIHSAKAISLGCCSTKHFSMSDTISLNTPASFLLSARAVAVCSEIRKISNKIMIKGEAVVEICYVNANEKTCTERVKHTMPINQIIEYDGMNESYIGKVRLKVAAVDVIPKGDTQGMFTAFDISLGISATSTMYEERELQFITDAYSVDSALEVSKTTLRVFDMADDFDDTYVFEGDFSISGEGVLNVVDCCGQLTDIKTSAENDDLVISGSLSLNAIIKDKTGSLSAVNKIFDFKYCHKGDYKNKNIVCTPHISVVSADCNIKGENALFVRAEINVSGFVMSYDTVECVVSLAQSEKPLKRNTNAITVYFPEEANESLWGIARRYNTTVKAIAEENNLEGETTESLKMIFIPCM